MPVRGSGEPSRPSAVAGRRRLEDGAGSEGLFLCGLFKFMAVTALSYSTGNAWGYLQRKFTLRTRSSEYNILSQYPCVCQTLAQLASLQ